MYFQSSRYNRYGSASDVPTQMSSRPSSYSEYSRSTPSLEKDYKKVTCTDNTTLSLVKEFVLSLEEKAMQHIGFPTFKLPKSTKNL